MFDDAIKDIHGDFLPKGSFFTVEGTSTDCFDSCVCELPTKPQWKKIKDTRYLSPFQKEFYIYRLHTNGKRRYEVKYKFEINTTKSLQIAPGACAKPKDA